MKNYIPTINISSLLKSDFNSLSANNTIKKIEKACVEVGFFQITGHGINKKDIANITKVGKTFFNSSIKAFDAFIVLNVNKEISPFTINIFEKEKRISLSSVSVILSVKITMVLSRL